MASKQLCMGDFLPRRAAAPQADNLRRAAGKNCGLQSSDSESDLGGDELENSQHSISFEPVAHSTPDRRMVDKRPVPWTDQMCKMKRGCRRLPLDDDLSQPVLDAGQNVIGAITCPECGMFYTPELRRDALQHAVFHQHKLDKCQMLCQLAGQARTQALSGAHSELLVDHGSVLIHRVRPGCKGALRRRVEAVVSQLVNSEIGFCTRSDDIWAPHRQAFVAIGNSLTPQILAVLLVDLITEGRRVLQAPDGTCTVTPNSQPAQLGVNRLWVRADHRRRGLATQLVDAARCHAKYGISVPADRLAFSDPTEAGAAFARQYCDGDFMVYKFASVK